MSWSHQNATSCMLAKIMEHLGSHLNDLIYLFTSFSHTCSQSTTFYTCTRSRQGNCSFVAHMWITNYTRHDTGNYVTRSHSVFSGDGGNSSTVTVSK